jgi:hypothetical protein
MGSVIVLFYVLNFYCPFGLTVYCLFSQFLLHIFFYMKKNEIGGACSVYGGEERCIQGFGGET